MGQVCSYVSSREDEEAGGPGRPRAYSQGLEDINKGCLALAGVELPPGSARILVDLRRNIRELQSAVQGPRAPVVLPWTRPPPEDQLDWEARSPEGGRLLRVQVCVAALEIPAEEWIMGRLFLSDRGLLFEGGGGIMMDSESLSVGLISWRDVVNVSHRGADGSRAAQPSREVALTLREGLPYANIQLQLSIARDGEWIEKCWRACSGANELVARDLGDVEFRPLQLQEGEEPESEDEGVLEEASPNLRKAVAMLPTQAPAEGSTEPVYSDVIPNASLDQLRIMIDKDDWFMDRFLREVLGTFDMRWEPLLEPKRTPGVKVRRCRYMMPLPQDVPRAVASIIGMPKESSMTTIYHMRTTGDEVLLVHQTITHDVMYGDKFRAQDTHSFRASPSGGVSYTKWSEVVWLAALPWTHGMVKTTIEAKTLANGKAVCPEFVRVLCSELPS